MRTIGRRWPSTAAKGDRQAMCTRCGVQWRRSQLRRDTDGGLSCPDEGPGKDAVELSMLNAEGARDYAEALGTVDYEEGGAMDVDKTETTPAQSLVNTFVDSSWGKVTF